MSRLIVGPFNRVEGDVEVHLDISDGVVVDAKINAPLYRGFENMMRGKDPMDALTITPRICGICSISQSAAAARALAHAMDLTPSVAGAEMAQIIHGVENLADHITHFYLFFMCDFAREIYRGAPWFNSVEERFRAGGGTAVRQAIAARAKLMHIIGNMAGKWPHSLAIQPGGVTKTPTARDRLHMVNTLKEFRGFWKLNFLARLWRIS